MKKFLAIAAFTIFSCAGSAHAANYVVDGNFANGNSSFSTIFSPGTIGPWSVVSGSVDLIGGYWQAPSAGGGSVDLDGNSPGSIAQIFSAPTGNLLLTFSLSGNPDGLPNTKDLEVDINGSPIDTFTYTIGTNSKTDMEYVTETVAFFNPGGSVDLSFISKDVNSPYGPVIGNVSVSGTPLPASVLLFGTALLGLVGFSWTKSRRAIC